MKIENLILNQKYQSLPDNVLLALKSLGMSQIEKNTHTDTIDRCRLNFLLDNISKDTLKNGVIDIGANSGYFSFSLLEYTDKKIGIYESDMKYFLFIKEVTKIMKIEDRLLLNSKNFCFSEISSYRQEFVICLNVLHHIGRYFDKKITNKTQALDLISVYLRNLALNFKGIFFQIGFNWKGDTNLKLFENGLKMELINFVRKSLKGSNVEIKIGIYDQETNSYKPLDRNNILRFENLGEFRNRPLFYIERK